MPSPQNWRVVRGPDTWLLAESLFHDDEMPSEPVVIWFTVMYNGVEHRLSVVTEGIDRVRSEPGLFMIRGIGKLTNRGHEKVFDHLPVKVSFSIRSRAGVFNANF